MHRFRIPQNKRNVYVTNLVLIIILLVFGLWRYLQSKEESENLDYIWDMAKQLGDTPATHLRWDSACFNPTGLTHSDCFVSVHFTITLSREEFAKQLPKLGLTEVLQSDIDGSSIFTALNTSHSDSEKLIQLTESGNNHGNKSLNNPSGYRWRFRNANNKNINIMFYEFQEDMETYKIDEKIFNDNIVTVQLQTKGN